MNGGTIRDNFLSTYVSGNLSRPSLSWNEGEMYGGGVLIESGSFSMNDGSIRNNFAFSGGGGVSIREGAVFIMNGGIVSSNSALWGGGIYSLGSFTMRGGTISDNSASGFGGGIATERNSIFVKSGGVIYGSDASEGHANRTMYGTGGNAVMAVDNNGDVFYWLRNATSGEDHSMNNRQTAASGGWEEKYYSSR
jgi:hypothetical protein